MTNAELIIAQAKRIEQITAENTELRDKLAEANEVKKYWFNQAQHSIPVHYPSSVEEHNLLADLIKMGVKL